MASLPRRPEAPKASGLDPTFEKKPPGRTETTVSAPIEILGAERVLPMLIGNEEKRLLLKGILTNPDDLKLRLAYADKLPADQKPYAKFIRNQVWLAQQREKYLDAEWLHAVDEDEDLERAFGFLWTPPVLQDGAVTYREYRAGFIELIETSAEFFLENAVEIFGQAPVRHLVLNGAREAMERLAASQHLRKIRSLDLRHNELGDAEARVLSASGQLRELRWLSLAGNHITRDGGRALALATREGRFPSLRFVDLGGNPFDPADRPVYDDDAIIGFDQPAEAQEINSIAELPWIHRGQRGERFEVADRYR